MGIGGVGVVGRGFWELPWFRLRRLRRGFRMGMVVGMGGMDMGGI